MSDSKYGDIEKRVRTSFENSCICWIEEITYPLIDEYVNCRESLGGDFKELSLFHGTHEKLVNIIIREGFDPSKNVRSVYGRGAYFAKDASYSFNYMASNEGNDISFMFLCDVLVDHSVLTNSVLTNSVLTNARENPTIFVVPKREAILPRYVIAFHKSAK